MVRAVPLVVLLSSCAAWRAEVTTVYLVRHTEKAADPGGDPALTAAGRVRAHALAGLLDNVDAVFATPYRRTRETVEPVAEARAVRVRIVGAHDTRAVIDPIRTVLRGKRILVAGHSNTLPDLIRALGVREPVSLGADDYGDLFVVTLGADGSATLERRRFGP